MRKASGLQRWTPFLILAFSAALLLFFSTSSPLYPTNPWFDANCYLTVARGMRAGMVPYRDLMEQKGPLLYALHVIPSLIPGRGGFFGVYLLEVAALALFLEISRRTLLLFCDNRSYIVPMLAAVAAGMLAMLAFCYGDSTEELCLPMLAWSLYDATRCIKGGEEMPDSRLLRNGVLAGCVLWIKYSLLGLHFGWMAFFALDCIARRRGWLRAARMCLIFLAGMLLATLPWLLYFGWNGALGDLFQVYFADNLHYYAEPVPYLQKLQMCLQRAFRYNLLPMLLVAIGAGWAVFSRQFSARNKLCLLTMIASTALFVAVSGKVLPYMFYIWGVFAPRGLLPFLWLIERMRGRWPRFVGAIAIGLSLCACCALITRGNMIDGIGYPREQLPQVKFAQEMHKTENPSLLSCGFLDGGFYLAADVLPQERWFCSLNIMGKVRREEQKRSIESGRPDYVVTQQRTLNELGISTERYEFVMAGKDDYNTLEGPFTYYLYRKKGIA